MNVYYRYYFTVLLTISIIFFNCGGKSGDWKIFEPKPPTKNGLKSIIAFSKSDIWCVGDKGIILHYDGNIWELFKVTNQTLYCVKGTNSNDIWVAGFDNTILHFNGHRWVNMGLQFPKADDYFVTICVNSHSKYEVFVGGFRPKGMLTRFLEQSFRASRFLCALDLLLPYAKGVLYKLDRNGLQEISLPDDVKMVSDIKVFGKGDIIIATTPYNLYHYDGAELIEVRLPATPYKIWGLSLKEFWITVHPASWMESSLCKYHNGRITKENITRIPFLRGLGGIHGVDNDVWAVGPLRSIYHYSNGSWQLEEYDGYFGKFQFLSRDAYLLHGIWALDHDNVYAVGDKGILLEYVGGLNTMKK